MKKGLLVIRRGSDSQITIYEIFHPCILDHDRINEIIAIGKERYANYKSKECPEIECIITQLILNGYTIGLPDFIHADIL